MLHRVIFNLFIFILDLGSKTMGQRRFFISINLMEGIRLCLSMITFGGMNRGSSFMGYFQTIAWIKPTFCPFLLFNDSSDISLRLELTLNSVLPILKFSPSVFFRQNSSKKTESLFFVSNVQAQRLIYSFKMMLLVDRSKKHSIFLDSQGLPEQKLKVLWYYWAYFLRITPVIDMDQGLRLRNRYKCDSRYVQVRQICEKYTLT